MMVRIINKFLNDDGRNSKLVFRVAIIFIAPSYLSQFFLIPNGSLQGDSSQYGYGNTRDWKLLSFFGNAIRKWPEVLINTLLGNQVLQVAFQFTVSLLAWFFLLNEIRKYLRNSMPPILLLTALACSPHVLTWNSTLLSESYLVSALILVTGSVIRFIKSNSRRNFLLLSICTLVFLNIKPAILYSIVGSLLILLLFILLRIKQVSKKIIKHKKQIFGKVFVMVLILSYTLITNLIQSQEIFGWKLTYRAAAAVTVFSEANPEARLVTKELSKVNELKCINVTNIRSSDSNAVLLRDNCPEARLWLSEEFPSWYLSFILNNPIYAAKLFLTGITVGNSPVSFYSGSISIAPNFVNDLFFGSRNLALRQTSESAQDIQLNRMIVTSPLVGWILLCLIMVYRKRRDLFNLQLTNGPILLDRFLCYLFILGIIGIASSSILNPNEWFRQSIVYQIMIILSTILLLSSEHDSKH